MLQFSKLSIKKIFLIAAPLAAILLAAGGLFFWNIFQKKVEVEFVFNNNTPATVNSENLAIDTTLWSLRPKCENCEKNKSNYAQILFVGDLMFDRYIRQAAEEKSNDFIFEKVSDFLKNFDLVVANLEGPITLNKSISVGTAPASADNYVFTFDPSLAKTLFEKNIRLVDLGNNHILNFGQKGLDSTQKYLSETNISYFGTPNGQESIVKEINGAKIAFVSYNQFADNPLENQKTALEEIRKDKQEANIIVLCAHWGIEYSNNPSQMIKDLAHQFIDAGADLIVGTHPHVIEPLEEYHGKRIYYSLGNFIFDQYFNASVRQGLGVIVKINLQTKELNFSEKKFSLELNGQTSLPD